MRVNTSASGPKTQRRGQQHQAANAIGVQRADVRRLPERLPGSLLGTASYNAAPRAFGTERWIDGALSVADPTLARRHWQVERWALDEFALPRRLVAQLVVQIVREDRFARGTLDVRGRRAAQSGVRAPLLCVIDPQCSLIPPATVLSFVDAAASRDKSVLHYERDGRRVAAPRRAAGQPTRAHASLWPRIVQWIGAH
jgi:polyhydroxyalkanoate synthase